LKLVHSALLSRICKGPNNQNSERGIETYVNGDPGQGLEKGPNNQNSERGIETRCCLSPLRQMPRPNNQNSERGIETIWMRRGMWPIVWVRTTRIPSGELKHYMPAVDGGAARQVRTTRIPSGELKLPLIDTIVDAPRKSEQPEFRAGN